MRGMMAKIPGYLSAAIFIRIFMVIGSVGGIFAVFTADDDRFIFWDETNPTNIKPYCGVVFGMVIVYNVFFKIYYVCKMRVLILDEERKLKEEA